MKSRYTLTVTTVKEHEEEHLTYGVALTLPDGTVRQIPDVSDDRAMMEGLIHDLNKWEVAPVHLDGIIDDLLS